MRKVKTHETLPRLLKARGLTTTKLSKLTKIPNSTLSTWLTPGVKPKDPEQVATVAEALGVTMFELLFGEREDERDLAVENLELEPVLDGLYRLRLEKVVLPKRKKE